MSQRPFTPAKFAKEWQGVDATEGTFSQSHFIVLRRKPLGIRDEGLRPE